MSHSRHGTSLSNICCYAHACLHFCPAWPTGQVLLPQLLSPDQPGDNPHPDAEQKVDDHRLPAHIGDNVSILMSQQCPSSVHLHYRKLSQRFNNFFQAKGNQDEQHEVHQAPSNYVKTQKDQSCLILPDPDNEEEKARREGGDRIGVRAHHLKQSIYHEWLRRSHLDDAGSDSEEGSEGKQGNVLEGEPEFANCTFVLQQVLRVAHQVLLCTALANHQQ